MTDAKRTRRHAKHDDEEYRRPSKNPASLFEAVQHWTQCDQESALVYLGELAYCSMHNKVSIGPGVQYSIDDERRSECKLCTQGDSWFDRIPTDGGDPDAAEKAWQMLYEEEQQRLVDEDLDYIETGKRVDKPKDELREFEARKLAMWLTYTFAAWAVSVKRRQGDDDDSLHQYLTRYVNHLFGRTANARFKMYCFEHHELGDLIMHRQRARYHPCGICVRKTETYSSSSSSSSSSNTKKSVTTSAAAAAAAAAAAVASVDSITVETNEDDNGTELASRATTSESTKNKRRELASHTPSYLTSATTAQLESEYEQQQSSSNL